MGISAETFVGGYGKAFGPGGMRDKRQEIEEERANRALNREVTKHNLELSKAKLQDAEEERKYLLSERERKRPDMLAEEERKRDAAIIKFHTATSASDRALFTKAVISALNSTPTNGGMAAAEKFINQSYEFDVLPGSIKKTPEGLSFSSADGTQGFIDYVTLAKLTGAQYITDPKTGKGVWKDAEQLKRERASAAKAAENRHAIKMEQVKGDQSRMTEAAKFGIKQGSGEPTAAEKHFERNIKAYIAADQKRLGGGSLPKNAAGHLAHITSFLSRTNPGMTVGAGWNKALAGYDKLIAIGKKKGAAAFEEKANKGYTPLTGDAAVVGTSKEEFVKAYTDKFINDTLKQMVIPRGVPQFPIQGAAVPPAPSVPSVPPEAGGMQKPSAPGLDAVAQPQAASPASASGPQTTPTPEQLSLMHSPAEAAPQEPPGTAPTDAASAPAAPHPNPVAGLQMMENAQAGELPTNDKPESQGGGAPETGMLEMASTPEELQAKTEAQEAQEAQAALDAGPERVAGLAEAEKAIVGTLKNVPGVIGNYLLRRINSGGRKGKVVQEAFASLTRAVEDWARSSTRATGVKQASAAIKNAKSTGYTKRMMRDGLAYFGGLDEEAKDIVRVIFAKEAAGYGKDAAWAKSKLHKLE